MNDGMKLTRHETWLRMWQSGEDENGENATRMRDVLGNSVFIGALKGRPSKLEGFTAEVSDEEGEVWRIEGTKVTLLGNQDTAEPTI